MSKRKRRKPARRTTWARPLLGIVAAAVIAFLFWWNPLPARRPSQTVHVARATASPAAAPVDAIRTPAAAPSTTPLAPPAHVTHDATAPTARDEAQHDPEAGAGNARVALVIDDCGQHLDLERRFLELGVPLTVSVLPHVRYAAEIAAAARAANDGVMLHLPMENHAGYDPGEGTITTAMDDATINALVRADLDAVPLATGVNNHEGSRATADERVMRDVAAVLADRRRFFVDSRTTAATVGEREARAAGIPTVRRDVFLDNIDDRASVETQLRRAAEIARLHGSAVAIGHPREATYAAIAALASGLQRDGVTFVLVADLVH